MGEYKRLISYIYSYEEGMKSKNSGFAKIECRNEICKISISLRISEALINEADNNMLQVFLFTRKKKPESSSTGEQITKILIGHIKVVNGCSIFKGQVNSEEIGMNHISIDDISGIFICSKAFLYKKSKLNIIYASEWDDIPIDTNLFAEEPPVELKASDIETEDTEVGNDNIDNTEGNTINDDRVNEDNNDNKGEEKDKCVTCRQQLERLISSEDTSEDYFQKLCRCYPKVRVEEIEGECIKINPHDISYLPKRYWHLCNNSFLLHGYYSYKYLLLCKKDEVSNEYMICVPGMFHNKEQMMAKMFGFSEFCCGKNEKEIMRFGYWCMDLQ